MTTLTPPPEIDVDLFVREYEAERRRASRAAVRDHLPPEAHPGYAAVLAELIRVDLEWEWAAGRRPRVADYAREFPRLTGSPHLLAGVAFEEYRQRLEHGEQPTAGEYAEQFGIDTADWCSRVGESEGRSAGSGVRTLVVSPKVATGTTPEDVVATARVYLEFRGADGSDPGRSLAPGRPAGAAPLAAGLFRDLHDSDPAAASRLAEAVVAFPEVGSDFLGFRLIGELGRGAFGRVYLAEQAELAGRSVALKVTAELTAESQTLAQLQHTNIVPVYSVHRYGAVQAVCMPYFGATTLGDVLQEIRVDGRLPDSGVALVSTLNHRKRSTLVDSRRSVPSVVHDGDPTPEAPAVDCPPVPVKTTDILAKFERLSYVDAILWVVARLADGLAHAHQRGIVHRDLKPANVLLTDEGQPMLLDFNLAEDPTAGGASAARVGGTLPYMAPEHLEAFRGGQGTIDARSDLYSLGLILFELLTGRPAFTMPRGPMSRVLPELIQARRAGAPPVQRLNPRVSPAVGAIVRKCLDGDPARRYQSAADLKEDIERHLADLPLRHAPNPSLRERARKWARRNPRLTSTTTTVALAAVVFLATGLVALGRWDRQQENLRELARQRDRTEAAEALGQLEKDRQLQLAMIHARDPDTAALERIAEHSAAALKPYGFPQDPAWDGKKLVRDLDPAARDRLKREVAEVALTWADALLVCAQRMANPDRRVADLDRSWELNEFVATCVTADQLGPEYWTQRATIAGQRGRPADAEEYARKADVLPLRTARDYFQRATRRMRQLEFADALPLLKEATRLDPNHLWAWFAQGNCLHQLSQYDAAVSCYSTCLALAPEAQTAFFPLLNRSKSYALLGRRDEAAADVNRAVEVAGALPAGMGEFERALARFQRAAFREQQRDFAAAEEDLTGVLDSPALKIQALLARSRVRTGRDDPKGARADRDEALRLAPQDEAGWNDRGLARIEDDPRGALADFEEALKINRRYYPSLQNKAHVLSESLGRPKESIAVLDQLLDVYPEFGEARIGRAVLLARLGKRTEAHADAVLALARNPKPSTFYQAANVYALTAKQVPADAERVPVLMAVALMGRFGDDVIDTDADMDPVRKHADFQKALRVARGLQADIQKERR